MPRPSERRPSSSFFDEPTTSLTDRETGRLFGLIDRLRRSGLAVLYISHNLADIRRLCDCVAILRDGRLQAAGPTNEFSEARLISLMVGRELTQIFPHRPRASPGELVLEVRDLTRDGVIEEITFQLHRGEILGLAGLLGAGRTEVARCLFGLDSFDRGEILIRGHALSANRPQTGIRHGMAFVTENRREEGILPDANVEENISLVSISHFGSNLLGWLQYRTLQACVDRIIRALQIDCQTPTRTSIRTLSGGNQQKAVFAKWLLNAPSILLLDEPTRGVDVGAKFEIYRMINDLVERGASVLLISSEIEELLGLCDRILVMHQGRLTGSFRRNEFDRERILGCALGEERVS